MQANELQDSETGPTLSKFISLPASSNIAYMNHIADGNSKLRRLISFLHTKWTNLQRIIHFCISDNEIPTLDTCKETNTI